MQEPRERTSDATLERLAETERALGLSLRRTRAIVDNTPSFIAVKDLDGRYVMANAEAGRVVGIPPHELVGRLCVEVFPDALARQLRTNDAIAAAEGRPVYDEAVLEGEDGEPRTFATVTFPLPGDDGLPAEVCTVATDITERRERDDERRERLEWEQRIGDALAGGRMVAFAQPIADATTGEEVAAELLVRMRHEDRPDELISPGEFLPPAERHGLVPAIDTWMLRQALALGGERRLDVNLSAVSLCDQTTRREILDLLAGAPSAAANIVFEITETAAVGHLEAASSFAREITGLGCGLALDDFGTGFGSFTHLRSLPVRYLKIDMSFVTDLVTSRDDRRVVQSIIGIAHHFDLSTIAEGVHDQATLDMLRGMGADYVQGFHTGVPAPVGNGHVVH